MRSVICPEDALALHQKINQTSRPYPRDSSLPQRFEHWVERRPDAPAVVQGDRELSYRELNRLANGLAHELRDRGVGPGTTVAVCLVRSPEMLVALLGVLKSGGTYVPLDPEWPDERLRALIGDASCRWLLTDRPDSMPGRVDGSGCPVLSVDVGTTRADDANQPCPATAESIACVNFTSGSTGRPKGVPILHRGIVRLVSGATYGPLNEQSRVLQVTPFTFDIATWEIWGALLNGGTSVMHPAEFVQLSRLHRTIRDGRASIMLLTTALFNSIIDEIPEALETVATITTGGEACSPRHMAKAVRTYGPGRVVHLYGPTECTCIATSYAVDEVPDEHVPLPIGQPIQNTRIYVIDQDANRLCGPGESGEICLGGDGLAAGYLGQPELTAKTFVHRLVGGVPERLYRTGDRGHLLPSGDLVFEGRWDDQVKVNSYRIELGEVTDPLIQHPAVKQGYVTVRDDYAGRSLVAFVVPAFPTVTSAELRDHLATKLPRYMVPAQIHLREVFPLTPNGKIDGSALLASCGPSATQGVSNDE